MPIVRFPGVLQGMMEFEKIFPSKVPPFEIILLGMVKDGAIRLDIDVSQKARVSLCLDNSKRLTFQAI